MQIAEATVDTVDRSGSGRPLRDLLGEARLLYQQAEQRRRTDPHAALALADDAQALLTDAEMASPGLARDPAFLLARSHARRVAGYCAERLSEYARAIRHGEAAIGFAEAAEKVAVSEKLLEEVRMACANACSLLGNVYDRLGDFVASLGYRRQNLEILTELGSRKDRAHGLLQIANSYYRLADYPTTLNCYQEALTISQELGDRTGEGSAWNGIGNVQYSQGLYAEAVESYSRGLRAFEAEEEPYWQAGLLGNIAGAYLQLNRLDEARDCSLRSLILRAKIGDRHGQGYSHDILARIYLKMGRAAKAREAALRSLCFFEEVNDRTGLVYAAKSLAQACAEVGETQAALRHYRTALINAEEAGLRELVYQVAESLSELYESLGDHASALECYRKFHRVRESLFNEENNRKLQNLRSLQEVEEARREADLYRKYSQELEAANRRQAELLRQLEFQSEELERQARTDPLTGLLNRRAFKELFDQEFYRTQQAGAPLTVVLLDLDNFKDVNDRFLHQIGDAVIRTVARLFEKHSPEKTIIARYGGEEFALVFPGSPLETALECCETIRKAVEGYDWKTLHPDLAVTISGGLCADTALPYPDKMLSVADARLYQAKAAGRNRMEK